MKGMRKRAVIGLAVESLEGRALLSGAAVSLPPALASRLAQVSAALAIPRGVKIDPAGVAAVMNALNGGAGSEFVTLVRRGAPNLLNVVRQFMSGARTEFVAPGVVAKIPRWNPAYTGTRYDHLTATLAGAVVLPGNRLELAAVMRGPFDEAVPCQLVFGINRGAGGSLGPIFSSRPGLTPDALVTINVGPYGQNNTATVTDLRTGVITPLDASSVQVIGAVSRVYVPLSLLPSTGATTANYKFAMWTRASADGGIENVGSFLPDAQGSMVPVGILNPTPPRRR